MPKAPSQPLNALKAKRLKKPGKYAAGENLYLIVSNRSGGGVTKRWYWRGTVHRERREISIGPYSEFSLAEARDLALQWRRTARLGGDPAHERGKATEPVLTFKKAAQKCYEEAIVGGLNNIKHRIQWIRTLEVYVFPKIGKRRINSVTQEDIINIFAPFWASKNETASRTLQRVKRVFDWARPRSDCQLGNQMNPADIPRDVLPNIPKTEQKHHAALSYCDLPALMHRLENIDAISAYALRFLILTASRPGEVRGAKWSEFDLEKGLWSIPAERMKARVAHEVPLSESAIAILKKVRGLSDKLVFPSVRDPYKKMSDSTMNSLLDRMNVPRSLTTVHGFRSTFRDWAEDKTDSSHEVKEMCLAHTIKNKAEAAYRRTKLLEQRHDLLDAWARFSTYNG